MTFMWRKIVDVIKYGENIWLIYKEFYEIYFVCLVRVWIIKWITLRHELTTSIICISVKPKLNWSGSVSLTTGRSSVLYVSKSSCNSRFSFFPAEHSVNMKKKSLLVRIFQFQTSFVILVNLEPWIFELLSLLSKSGFRHHSNRLDSPTWIDDDHAEKNHNRNASINRWLARELYGGVVLDFQSATPSMMIEKKLKTDTCHLRRGTGKNGKNILTMDHRRWIYFYT